MEKTKIKDFNHYVPESYHKVKTRGRELIKFTNWKKTDDEKEVYANYLEQNPKKHVGPQHYWKFPKLDPRKRKKDDKKLIIQQKEDDNGNKVYFMDRGFTDKFVSKPMKKHLF